MQLGVWLRRSLVAAGSLLVVMSMTRTVVRAHHGWGGYQDNTTDISGTVTSPASLAGPHATMKIKTADGNIWDVVLAPPPRSESAGVKEGMFPVGEKVIVHGNRSRDPKKYEIKTSQVTWNGKVYKVYPDRP